MKTTSHKPDYKKLYFNHYKNTDLMLYFGHLAVAVLLLRIYQCLRVEENHSKSIFSKKQL